MVEERTSGRRDPQEILQSRSAPIIDRAPLPTVEVQGSTHMVTHVNSAFCNLLGKTRADLLGKSFAEIIPGGKDCTPLLDSVYQTGEAVTLAQGDPEAMASWLYAMWPALDPNERPVGIIIQLAKVAQFRQKVTEINEALLIAGLRQHELIEASATLNQQLQSEIAERKQAQAELREAVEQAQRATSARENLLAAVSHDLGNPLSVILMNVAVMTMPSGSDDRRKSKKKLESIKRAADRMKRLIEDLLDTVSIEAGKLSVEPRRLAVAPLVAEAIDAMASLAARKSLQFTNELPADLPPVLADNGRLVQVFANLLGNAIKFTPEGGKITVRADTVGETVQFSVTDTGAGIPEQDLPHLFDRFWQARPTALQGTGLGLNIVRGIVEAHGGRIWVDSRVGAGSTFLFTLPLALHDAELVERESVREVNSSSSLQTEIEKQATDLEVVLQENRERELHTAQLHTALESTQRTEPGIARELAEGAGQLPRDFMSLVSHELRGPLTAIELLIERMRRSRETPPTSDQEKITQRMFAAVARLSAVIESLLQHALIKSGRLTTRMETFDVRPMAAEVFDELRPYAEEKGLHLRYATATDLPSLRSDPVLVRLILLNLVGNAIKFTERGAVEIWIDCAAAGCRIAVKDSGPGIPAGDRVRIFEPFAKAEGSKQKHVPGIGLGLALVQELASALGGHVDLDSELGRGSTFTVTLPPGSELLQGATASHDEGASEWPA